MWFKNLGIMLDPIWRQNKVYFVTFLVWDCIQSPLSTMLYVYLMQTSINQLSSGAGIWTIVITILVFLTLELLLHIGGDVLYSLYFEPCQAKIIANVNIDVCKHIRCTDYKYFDNPDYYDEYTVSYNEEYVPGKQAYGIEYFPHDYLLIGFDDEKEVFNSVGYLTKQLVNFEIPYKNMELALKTLKSNKPILNFYKYNTDKDFKVDVNKIISGLKDYISSSNSTQHHAQGFFYGLEAVIRLGEHIINDGEKSNFDHRYTRGLMEHKHIMVKRIEYLCNNQYLSNNKCIYSAYRVFEYAKIIHNLGIRFKLLRDQNLLKEIMAIIQKMKNIELEYLASVKGELELFDT